MAKKKTIKKIKAANRMMRRNLDMIDYIVNCAIADSYLLGAEDEDENKADHGRIYQTYRRALRKIATEVRDMGCVENYWHHKFLEMGLMRSAKTEIDREIAATVARQMDDDDLAEQMENA